MELETAIIAVVEASVSCRAVAVVVLAFLMVVPARSDSRNQVFSDFKTHLPLGADQTLVLGIVGGWDRWDNTERITPRLAQMGGHLRMEYDPDVWNRVRDLIASALSAN